MCDTETHKQTLDTTVLEVPKATKVTKNYFKIIGLRPLFWKPQGPHLEMTKKTFIICGKS